MNERISIGGQAVIEGVMMRSPTCIATAVRKPSGEIVYKKTPISKEREISRNSFYKRSCYAF